MSRLTFLLLMCLITLNFTACATTQRTAYITDLKTKAKDGDEISQYNLGKYFQQISNMQQALFWYKKSAEQNYSFAQNEIGNLYMEGNGVKKDYEKAMSWYQKAAKNNFFDAINNIGYMYDLGLGVDENDRKAIQLYKKAALKGSTRAMVNLGAMYKTGENIEQNLIESYKWFELAKKHFFNGVYQNKNLYLYIGKQQNKLEQIMSDGQIKQAKKLSLKW